MSFYQTTKFSSFLNAFADDKFEVEMVPVSKIVEDIGGITEHADFKVTKQSTLTNWNIYKYIQTYKSTTECNILSAYTLF